MKLYVARHGQTQANVEHLFNGRNCICQVNIGSSAIYLINIVEEPFVLINQSYIFHT